MFIFALILILGVDCSYGGSKNSESVIGTNRSSNSTLNYNIAPTLTTKSLPNDQVLTQEGSGVLEGPRPDSKYKIRVTFDSITIHNDREGSLSGDGEFDLSAHVQGKRVDLTGGTGYSCIRTVIPALGGPPVPQQSWCEKLWDAEEGATYSFNPGTEVTVEIPEGATFLISTGGWEIDDERGTWRSDDDPFVLENVAVLNDPKIVDKGQAISNLAGSMYIKADPGSIQANRNDALGYLIAPYDLTTEFGKGSHEEASYLSSGQPDYTLRYTISVIPPPLRQLDEIPTQVLEVAECNNNLAISSVISSASQATFPPTNAIDNNLSTKWFSTNTLNPFITLNLGSPKSVCSVDIAWADGNSHQYRFNVTVSNDGNVFTNAFSGISTGTTTSSEKYTFMVPQQANFVKITITQSTPGSPNSIAQISEIDLFGGDLASSKPPRIVQEDDNLTFSETQRIQSSMNLTN